MPCPAFDASGIPERTLATARAGWLRLCADERESVTAVALIIRDLAMLGAPPPVLGSFARVLEDEIRHVEVCATVVRALGGTVAEQAPQALDELGPGDRRWRTARALVAGFVAGESLSAAALARRFEPTSPNAVWVTDVTYVWTDEGWLYLAIMLDLFARKAVGWATSTVNDTALALAALDVALTARRLRQGWCITRIAEAPMRAPTTVLRSRLEASSRA